MSEATLAVKLEIPDAEPGEVVDFAPRPNVDARSEEAKHRSVGSVVPDEHALDSVASWRSALWRADGSSAARHLDHLQWRRYVDPDLFPCAAGLDRSGGLGVAWKTRAGSA
jgi:hypothetical protein